MTPFADFIVPFVSPVSGVTHGPFVLNDQLDLRFKKIVGLKEFQRETKRDITVQPPLSVVISQ